MNPTYINYNIETKVKKPYGVFGLNDMQKGTIDVIHPNPLFMSENTHNVIFNNFQVTKILETRKAKGEYRDESMRPYWTRLQVVRF